MKFSENCMNFSQKKKRETAFFKMDDEIDYSMPPLQRLQEYVKSNQDFKLIHCSECVIDCASVVTLEQVHSILIPSIKTLLNYEDEEISDSMLMMVPDFVDALFDNFPDDAEDLLTQSILPLVHDIGTDQSDQYAESYAALAVKLDTDYYIKNEVPFLQELAQNDDEITRLTVTNILLFLVEHINPSLWYNGLFAIISDLSSDSSAEIRTKIPPLIALYTKQLQSPREKTLLSAKFVLFIRDSADNVRVAAAESLVTLCTALDASSNLVTVIPAARQLLNDQSELTRTTMKKNIGPLVAQLGKQADRSLVSQYCNALFSTDANIAYAAAYSFPAVAISIGADRFDELRSGFDHASASREFMVRRTLAYGLIEYATILGPEDLYDATMNFLKDIPSVSVGILTNLDRFIEFLIDKKDDFLWALQDPCRFKEWRLRMEISKQLRKCQQFFKREDLVAIAKQLVIDGVWVVRCDAADSFVELMDDDDVKFVCNLASYREYYVREEASRIIRLMDSNYIDENEKDVFDALKKLSEDKVANVKIEAARAARYLLKEREDCGELKAIYEKLKNDKDADVIYAINNDIEEIECGGNNDVEEEEEEDAAD